MPFLGLGKQPPSLEELQAENEKLDVEVSVEQKREILKRLKERHVQMRSFGGSFRSALNWLKTH